MTKTEWLAKLALARTVWGKAVGEEEEAATWAAWGDVEAEWYCVDAVNEKEVGDERG